MKVNEFQMWRHDRRRRWLLIKTSCYQDFSECSKRGNTIDVSTSVSSIKNLTYRAMAILHLYKLKKLPKDAASATKVYLFLDLIYEYDLAKNFTG